MNADFSIPELMGEAYGGSAKQAGLDGHIIKPKKLQDNRGEMTRQPLLQLA